MYALEVAASVKLKVIQLVRNDFPCGPSAVWLAAGSTYYAGYGNIMLGQDLGWEHFEWPITYQSVNFIFMSSALEPFLSCVL